MTSVYGRKGGRIPIKMDLQFPAIFALAMIVGSFLTCNNHQNVWFSSLRRIGYSRSL